jgi:multiple sugar transport system permease protein
MPFIWMVAGSFKTYSELTGGGSLLPENWTFENYEELIHRVNFPAAYANSIIIAVTVTLSVLLTSSAAAYVFAKYRFWGKDQLFTVILSTMMVPFTVVMVPLYVTISNLGVANSVRGIIVTGLCSTFGIFMMRQFMETIPDELIDAGRIDGASEWWIFARLVLPLAGSPMAALAVFTFLGSWDSYLWPSVVLNAPDTKTLPLVLAGLRTIYWERYELFCTGGVMTVLPVMILYAFGQRQFIRGVAMTGLKG